MIDEHTFNKLKEFDHYSSWAVWKPCFKGPKSGIDDKSVFDDHDLLSKLNADYVFVGLNASKLMGGSWLNFHSNHRGSNDYKLRYVLSDTRFWGSYLTDIFKNDDPKNPTIEPNSKKFLEELSQEQIDRSIAQLRREISILGNPTIIAIGNDASRFLSKNMQEQEIYKITHYSYRVS